MNIVGIVILAFLAILVLCCSRRVALLGMVAGVLLLTQAQQIHLLGLNLFAIRFLELAGFMRVMGRREFSSSELNRVDQALITLYSYTTVVFLIRSSEGVANQIGIAVDAFLCYFTFRGLIKNAEEFFILLRDLVPLLTIYTGLVLVESFTQKNPFTLLEGITGGGHWMRHGRPRCFGSFRQPDTLGMFAASFLPLYIALACQIGKRKRAIIGIGLCLILVWAANCGGAASAAAAGLLGWGFWKFRTRMRTVRWGILAMIAGLAVVMNSPVWYVFARASSITGGDGWTRSYLFDKTFEHFGQWWLAGMPLIQTSLWFPFVLPGVGTADITNLYIWFGLTAGLPATVLLILLLIRAFRSLGVALAATRSKSLEVPGVEFLIWGLGVMLLVHIVDWFGIIYFDQMYVVWFMQLAAVSSISTHSILTSPDMSQGLIYRDSSKTSTD